jgi:hypothetical protein
VKKLRRRRLRKQGTTCGDEEWEAVRRKAWLRELLTNSSEGESVDEYSRFAESGRWIAEMRGAGTENSASRGGTRSWRCEHKVKTTSRGECSGLCEAGIVMLS